MTPVQDDRPRTTWTMYVDGSSNSKGSGAGLILENSDGLAVEVSLSFAFHTSNNQAEYEACIAGLQLAREFKAERLELHSDSLLVVSQIQELYDAKDDVLKNYLVKVRELLSQFDRAEIKHVPRTENTRADILSKLASTKVPGNHRSLIQGTLTRPSVSVKPSQPIAVLSADQSEDWIAPILQYITTGEEPADPKKARSLRLRATKYSVIEGQLYRRGFSSPLLRCLRPVESDHVLKDIHEGVCGGHQGARSIAKKALRAGFYWPTMDKDAKTLVQKCLKCQIHADVHVAPSSELQSLTSPWPFAWWGMDLLGPFPTAPGQLRFLIVAVDYFTKWIEAEPLATITSAKVIKFFNRNILARFGVPRQVITDNGTQFADKKFRELLAGLGVKQRFTSVEHPQTNGLAEAANRVLLRGLKRRLDEAKGNWVEELQSVLWAYRTTPHSTTGESPFRLVYGTDAVIPIEVSELNWRAQATSEPVENNQAIREELDLLEELRSQASLREELIKQKVAARYNSRVQKRDFAVGQLVLRRADVGNKNARQGKLAPNWEGPYRIVSKTGKGAYQLETMEGATIPRTWNSDKLRKYYT